MELTVRIEGLTDSWSSFGECERILENVRASLAAVRNNISYTAQHNSGAGANLREIETRLSNQKRSMWNLRNALGEISHEYTEMENKNIELCGGVAVGSNGSVNGGGTIGQNTEDETDSLVDWNDFWNLCSQFGGIGTAIGLIGSIITGGICANNGFNIAKGVLDVVNKGFKTISESEWDWKSLLDFKTAEMSDVNPLKGYSFGDAKGVTGKISVAAKWAGDILTIGENAYENIFENEEGNTTLRAVLETIGESAVDIGIGMALGAGATAIAATVGAPAVVAGAVVVVAKWGLDAVSEHFFDKDLGELVSDAVIDTGEAVWDWTTSTAKKVGDGAKKAADTVCKWVKGWFK